MFSLFWFQTVYFLQQDFIDRLLKFLIWHLYDTTAGQTDVGEKKTTTKQ